MPGGSTASRAAPAVVAVGVFGVSFGVLATATGVPAWLAIAMSAVIFAGSAQFAAVSLLAGPASVGAAVLSGVLLNSRYLATGAAAAPFLRGRLLHRFVAAQLVIDESYALAVQADGTLDAKVMLRSGAALWAAWVTGTAVGAALGPVAGDPRTLGLDAAFPAMFVALLWPMLRTPTARRTALVGAVAALVLSPLTPPGVPLAAAAAAGLMAAR